MKAEYVTIDPAKRTLSCRPPKKLPSPQRTARSRSLPIRHTDPTEPTRSREIIQGGSVGAYHKSRGPREKQRQTATSVYSRPVEAGVALSAAIRLKSKCFRFIGGPATMKDIPSRLAATAVC